MATLIDDGLLENTPDDPISHLELDHPTVINIDDINATIEDPGYILDETPDEYNQSEEEDEEEIYISAYKKPSFTLPVTFFDINRNISLLKKCRPISIQIVDCDIYPWYYKKNSRLTNNNNFLYNNDGPSKHQTLDLDSTDLKSLTYTCIKEPLSSSAQSNLPKINLSLEQTSVVLKLKEEIQDHIDDQNIITIVDEEINTLRNREDETRIIKTPTSQLPELNSTGKCNFDKGIAHNDLYKAIAQTIVRNIDAIEIRNKINDKNLSLQKALMKVTNSDLDEDVNFNKSAREKLVKSGNKEESINSEIIPSPILPSTIRSQQARSKPNMLCKSMTVNNIVEKCPDFNKRCDKLTFSSDKIIPHYHCRIPNSAINDNYFSSKTANQMYTQEWFSKDSALNWHQHFNSSNVSSSNSESTPARNAQGRQAAFSDSLGEKAHLDFIKKTCNNSLLSSSHVTKQQSTSISDHQYDYPSSLFYQNSGLRQASDFPSQYNVNNLRASAIQATKENCQVFSQSSTSNQNGYHYYGADLVSSLNKHDYSKTQIPFTGAVSDRTNRIQSYPILPHFLNFKNTSEYYHSALEQNGGAGPGTEVGRNPYPVLGKNYGLPSGPPPPSYEYYLSSKPYTQANNSQYTNTGLHWHSTSNSESGSLLKQTTDSRFGYPATNTSEQSLTNRFQNVPVDAPKVTNLIPFGMDGEVRNVSSYTEVQNNNQVSTASCENTNRNELTGVNTKVYTQGVARIPTKQSETKEKRKPKKNLTDSMIKILSNRKTTCLNSNENKYYDVINDKFSVKNIFNPLHKQPASSASLSNNITLQPTKDTYIVTSKQVSSSRKINGYSSPILPIPSFKESFKGSLGMLSEIQDCTNNNNLGTEPNKNMCDISKQYEHTKVKRKRKINDDEKGCISNKRISLQEYQLRRLENEKTMTYVNIFNNREEKVMKRMI